MLCLTRKAGQTILIGDNVTITVQRIDRNKVWLGIVAPKDVPIVRDDAVDREPTKEKRNEFA